MKKIINSFTNNCNKEYFTFSRDGKYLTYLKYEYDRRKIIVIDVTKYSGKSIFLEDEFSMHNIVQFIFDDENQLYFVCNYQYVFHILKISTKGEKLEIVPIATLKSGAMKIVDISKNSLLYSTFVDRNVTQLISLNLLTQKSKKLSEVEGLFKGTILIDENHVLVNIKTSKSNFDAFRMNIFTGGLELIFHISKKSNERVVLYEPENNICFFTTDISGCNRILYGNLGMQESYRLLDNNRTEDHTKIDQSPLIMGKSGEFVFGKYKM